MTSIVRKNERSWAIDLISKLNLIFAQNKLMIKKAGGETTISHEKNTMFPDVILYGNEEQTVILQGWELKMPDVPIEDETFIKDAQRKAIALNLNSCLIWNFTYAVLYVRNRDNTFSCAKQWNKTSYIRTREDVSTYRAEWEALLEEVILFINEYFVSGEFRNISLNEVVSDSVITSLISRNKVLISNHLKACASRDAHIEAHVDLWWKSVEVEYQNDENDKYSAYAKNVILNWANRIIFAHLIKRRHNAAFLIDTLDTSMSPSDGNFLFKKVTAKCDFYNIFSEIKYNELLPALSWRDFVELSYFLRDNSIAKIDQSTLQNILEKSVATNKREVNGQYTTPNELARILVRLTMIDKVGNLLDCCCGTGTIAKAGIVEKKEHLSPKEAAESVWACDKNQFPLQVANISMTSSDTMNIANRLFQHNALSLREGETIQITNPENGKVLDLKLPKFKTIVSNLPFVAFEVIDQEDKALINKIAKETGLDERADLSYFIAIKIEKVLDDDGRIGVITSNSWLGTESGLAFMEALQEKYHVRQIHISGKGRWFKNADVVTTILILEKKSAGKVPEIDFWLWKKSLEDLSANRRLEDLLVNSAILSKECDAQVAQVSRYSQEEMKSLAKLNLSYNSMFHNIKWILEIQDKIIPVHDVFVVFRGSRRGWDKMFFPKKGEHKIEKEYIANVLINAKSVNELIAKPDGEAFCCSEEIEDLRRLGHKGAVTWIEKFATQKNGVGKLLPEVLKRKNMKWYEMKRNEVAEIFTMMNPDKRFFFSRFEKPSFINQRLIGFNHKASYSDIELNHALLNSIFTLFYIEASGFGRGLGVLDVNKKSISNCYMLNPKLVPKENREKIIDAFQQLRQRPIMNITEELKDPSRIKFEKAVLLSFGMQEYYDKIKSSLLSMQKTRATVKEC